MILNDAEITRRIGAEQILRGHDPALIRNCGYTLRAGRAFKTGDGAEDILGAPNTDSRRFFWQVGPTETLVIMTKEHVRLPLDMCALYSPLHRLAMQGVMLLNPAIVEPGYEGPLSCFLLNFSSQSVKIEVDQPISKIVFHTLSGQPARPVPMAFTDEQYERNLARFSAGFHRSFMNVSSIEDRAAAKAQGAVKGWAIAGGVMVALLVAFSSFEPIVSNFLWQRTGIITATQRTENVALLKDLETARQQLQSASNVKALEARSDALEKELAVLKEQLNDVRNARKQK